MPQESSSFEGAVAGLRGEDSIDFADIGFCANSTLGYSANTKNLGGDLIRRRKSKGAFWDR